MDLRVGDSLLWFCMLVIPSVCPSLKVAANDAPCCRLCCCCCHLLPISQLCRDCKICACTMKHLKIFFHRCHLLLLLLPRLLPLVPLHLASRRSQFNAAKCCRCRSCTVGSRSSSSCRSWLIFDLFEERWIRKVWHNREGYGSVWHGACIGSFHAVFIYLATALRC